MCLLYKKYTVLTKEVKNVVYAVTSKETSNHNQSTTSSSITYTVFEIVSQMQQSDKLHEILFVKTM